MEAEPDIGFTGLLAPHGDNRTAALAALRTRITYNDAVHRLTGYAPGLCREIARLWPQSSSASTQTRGSSTTRVEATNSRHRDQPGGRKALRIRDLTFPNTLKVDYAFPAPIESFFRRQYPGGIEVYAFREGVADPVNHLRQVMLARKD